MCAHRAKTRFCETRHVRMVHIFNGFEKCIRSIHRINYNLLRLTRSPDCRLNSVLNIILCNITIQKVTRVFKLYHEVIIAFGQSFRVVGVNRGKVQSGKA